LPTFTWASERQRLLHDPSPEVSVAWKDLIHLPSQLPRNSKGTAYYHEIREAKNNDKKKQEPYANN